MADKKDPRRSTQELVEIVSAELKKRDNLLAQLEGLRILVESNAKGDRRYGELIKRIDDTEKLCEDKKQWSVVENVIESITREVGRHFMAESLPKQDTPGSMATKTAIDEVRRSIATGDENAMAAAVPAVQPPPIPPDVSARPALRPLGAKPRPRPDVQMTDEEYARLMESMEQKNEKNIQNTELFDQLEASLWARVKNFREFRLPTMPVADSEEIDQRIAEINGKIGQARIFFKNGNIQKAEDLMQDAQIIIAELEEGKLGQRIKLASGEIDHLLAGVDESIKAAQKARPPVQTSGSMRPKTAMTTGEIEILLEGIGGDKEETEQKEIVPPPVVLPGLTKTVPGTMPALRLTPEEEAQVALLGEDTPEPAPSVGFLGKLEETRPPELGAPPAAARARQDAISVRPVPPPDAEPSVSGSSIVEMSDVEQTPPAGLDADRVARLREHITPAGPVQPHFSQHPGIESELPENAVPPPARQFQMGGNIPVPELVPLPKVIAVPTGIEPMHLKRELERPPSIEEQPAHSAVSGETVQMPAVVLEQARAESRRGPRLLELVDTEKIPYQIMSTLAQIDQIHFEKGVLEANEYIRKSAQDAPQMWEQIAHSAEFLRLARAWSRQKKMVAGEEKRIIWPENIDIAMRAIEDTERGVRVPEPVKKRPRFFRRWAQAIGLASAVRGDVAPLQSAYEAPPEPSVAAQIETPVPAPEIIPEEPVKEQSDLLGVVEDAEVSEDRDAGVAQDAMAAPTSEKKESVEALPQHSDKTFILQQLGEKPVTFIEGQYVTYNGKRYIVLGPSGDEKGGVILRHADSRRQFATTRLDQIVPDTDHKRERAYKGIAIQQLPGSRDGYKIRLSGGEGIEAGILTALTEHFGIDRDVARTAMVHASARAKTAGVQVIDSNRNIDIKHGFPEDVHGSFLLQVSGTTEHPAVTVTKVDTNL
ncbi:MAG: hypothetical protein COU35_03385 [Candidatus Magasanikbacteria bacterium CG10_big_fil_rev_8_21_14_0_10_47_10]|uniref:Uncharacterized protein n=1 Tax=Candidatus Magasanikbacteria bacterium CG10_big_fil_rev_8_21_14_0_10_47_10 TaxID=1974652 RepID=A0A2H0TQ68_9BACT|nr:MAG: hypothetical protein COU35_03385 [Candidatus Magasanikbacteria bacterium CG10_big_fil_rev_8_21_14_0_10_47_10]